ncbi:hypothetical protein [Telluribacter sp. SYSU D00476]|uniref:hypothetical protein n=1 Tax=Telluribacter sp. SYSU D00476 TaxID=2811430 RepID=UPI001FF36AAF|nr:hypothetical protein [Telluribacter sp. SYSU D00476]
MFCLAREYSFIAAITLNVTMMLNAEQKRNLEIEIKVLIDGASNDGFFTLHKQELIRIIAIKSTLNANDAGATDQVLYDLLNLNIL